MVACLSALRNSLIAQDFREDIPLLLEPAESLNASCTDTAARCARAVVDPSVTQGGGGGGVGGRGGGGGGGGGVRRMGRTQSDVAICMRAHLRLPVLGLAAVVERFVAVIER